MGICYSTVELKIVCKLYKKEMFIFALKLSSKNNLYMCIEERLEDIH